MKFTVSSSALLSLLSTTGKVINSKNTLPILDYFLMDLKDGELKVTTSDLETTLVGTLKVDNVEQEGMVAAPAKLMLDVLKECSEMPLTLEVNSDNWEIKISWKSGGSSVPGANPISYPAVQALSEDKIDVTMDVDTLVNGTVIGQTGCSLMNVGATSVRMKGRRIVELEYRNVSLDAYGEEPAVAARVREITDNPELNVSVGSTGVDLDKVGLADMFTTSLVEATGADIGMYHYGGIRLITLPAGEVSRAMLFTLEPFSSYVYTMEMTPEQMRRMIITKYNDTGNTKEAHRIDIFASVPYTIVTDGSDNALDVEFPTLKEGREYEVAIANYIVEKYDNVEGDDIECRDDVLVLDAIAKYVGEHSPAKFSNVPKQKRRVVR